MDTSMMITTGIANIGNLRIIENISISQIEFGLRRLLQTSYRLKIYICMHEGPQETEETFLK